MLYDCFTFFNEIDLLEIRLNEHAKFVDKFIVTEANKTHSGIEKPFLYEQHKEKFKEFEDKIIYLKLYYNDNNLPPTNLHHGHDLTCRREDFQREYAKQFLLNNNTKDDDIIIMSDLDEILNSKNIQELLPLLKQHSILRCLQKTSIYKLNIILQDYDTTGYDGPKVATWNYMKKHNWTDLRMHRGDIQFPVKCGWHFHYISAQPQDTFIKIKSYSHWPDFAHIQNDEDAVRAIMKMVNINPADKKVEIDDTFPSFLKNNIDKYKKYIF